MTVCHGREKNKIEWSINFETGSTTQNKNKVARRVGSSPRYITLCSAWQQKQKATINAPIDTRTDVENSEWSTRAAAAIGETFMVFGCMFY